MAQSRKEYFKNYKRKGIRTHPLYSTWKNIRNRCSNKNLREYPRYGGRGIKVCDRWQSYENFYTDLHKDYKKGLWLDRIDNDGNYEPMNYRWATPIEQQNNKYNNKKLFYAGKSQTLNEWAREINIKTSTIRQRYYGLGWGLIKCLETPVRIWTHKKERIVS